MTLVFMVFIWMPLFVNLTTPQSEISTTEKRKLAPKPKLKLESLAEFPKAYESYYNDHFGLRNTLVYWRNFLQVTCFAASTSDQVIVGKNGWFFQNGNPHLADIRNLWPFSGGELRHWANILERKYRWLKKRGVQYVFLVTPSKHLIYPEKLPDAFRPVHPTSRVDQLVAYLRQHTTVPVVDLRSALRKAKKDMRVYQKTDTHWNGYGAYIGYLELMKHLKTIKPDLPHVFLRKKDFSEISERGGDLTQLLNLADSIQEKQIKPSQWQENCFKNTSLQGEINNTTLNQNRFTTVCEPQKYRLLMFRDSFSLALMPYLSESFSLVDYVPQSPVRIKNMQDIVQRQLPDIVIEQRTSRWLRTPEG